MANRILLTTDSGFYKESDNSSQIVLGSIQLTSTTPFVIPAGSEMIQHLNAEFLQGLTVDQVRESVLADKKVLSYKVLENVVISNSTNKTNISDFLIINHTKPDTTLLSNTTEGIIVRNGSDYSKSFIVNQNNNGPVLDNTDTVMGTITEYLTNESVNLVWVNGSSTVEWSGALPLDIIGKYLKGEDNKYYKITNLTDNGNNTGTFTLDIAYTGPSTSNQMTLLYYELEFWKEQAVSGNEAYLNNITLKVYYPIRTNLQDILENGFGIPDIDYSKVLENTGFVDQATFDQLANTPILFDSTQGQNNSFSNGIDINDLQNDFTLKSVLGVNINIGGANDQVLISNLKFSGLTDANGTLLQTTFSELNQLHNIGSTVTATNLNKLTDGSFVTDLHKHAFKCVYNEGQLGDVVYIDNNNQTKLAVADYNTSPESMNALGILVKIDGTTAYIQSFGRVNVKNYGFLNNTAVYLSPTTPGDVTDTVPMNDGTFVLQIGVVQSGALILNIDFRWRN